MRWLALLAASFVLSLAGAAGAVPQPDAEAAYEQGDYATAFRLWLPLAQQGSPRAQLNVGRMYERGEGVPRDQQAAMDWYRKAADQNARDAAYLPAPDDYDGWKALDSIPDPAPANSAAAQSTPVFVPQPVQVRPIAYPPVYYQPVYRVAPVRPAPMRHMHFRH
jgi:TPR repeat protein